MRRPWIALALVALVGGVMAAPVAGTTTRIPTLCEEHLMTSWTVPREWVDEDMVLHIRGETATYHVTGDEYCAGTNEPVVDLNVDLATGQGTVVAKGHFTLDAFDGGWDGTLVAHLTPGGPYIWEGEFVGNGWGVLAGWQMRSHLVEVTHELILDDGFVFKPGR
jgi:hypothetical protein